VAWRDLRQVNAGKGWWRLPAIALALLLPLGAFPLDNPLQDKPARAGGDLPAQLAIEERPGSPFQLVGADPVALHASHVPVPLRSELDRLEGPQVRVERVDPKRRLPGRSLLVALLAISLLTGPLAESLPGERKRGTLETLLTAGISRAELVSGKWLAWTAAASLTVLLVALTGMADGTQEPGLWPLALPLCVGMAVALGLWLGRNAADEVAGAARTMRIIPLAALGLAAAAYALAEFSPALGAAVPLGGALLVAGDVLQGPAVLAASAAGSVVGIAALLHHTASGLSEVGLRRSAQGPLAPTFAAAVVWGLPVVGPVAWIAAGNPSFAAGLDADVGAAVGGGLLLALALVEHSRAHGELRRPTTRGWLRGLICGVALAMAAAASGWVPWPEDAVLAAARVRMSGALAPGHAPLAALLVVAGHELFFRGVLQQRVGLWATAAIWVVIASPLDPLRGAIAALTLGLLRSRCGLLAALAAHAAWALAPTSLSIPQPGLALLCGAIAVGWAAFRTPRLSAARRGSSR